jgi:hypothetical protein
MMPFTRITCAYFIADGQFIAPEPSAQTETQPATDTDTTIAPVRTTADVQSDSAAAELLHDVLASWDN